MLLTCLEAATARRSDWALSRLPADQPITRAALVIPKTPKRAEPTPTPAPAKTQRRTSPRIPGSPPKASPASSPMPPRAGRQVPLGRHGTITGYYIDGCQDSALCPSSPTCSEVAEGEPWIRNAPGQRHGTITGYWIDDCTTDAECPATPSCAAVAGGAPSAARPAVTIKPAARLPRAERQSRTAKPHEEVHGTVYGFRRGCKSETDCPNLAAGGQSCYQAHHAYYDDYRAKVKSGAGPEIKKHGSPTGYQMGCKVREECPEHIAGRTSCREAATAEERRRRREAGIPEQRPLVDAQPVMKHIADLRRQGMSITAIAAAGGVSKTGIRTLIYGREDYNSDGSKGPRHGEIPKHVDAEKARKILGVQFAKRPSRSTAEHGTRNGYRQLECHSQTDCPNVAEGGPSCYQANSDYNAAHRATPPRREFQGSTR